MSIFRVVAPLGALVCLTLLSACGTRYGGARCQAITLQTLPSSLPLGPRVPAEGHDFRQSDPFILGTAELGCCVMNPTFTVPADCSAVDCEQLLGRLTVASVGGPFRNEPCGAAEFPSGQLRGAGVCSVFLEGERVVGVRAFCFD